MKNYFVLSFLLLFFSTFVSSFELGQRNNLADFTGRGFMTCATCHSIDTSIQFTASSVYGSCYTAGALYPITLSINIDSTSSYIEYSTQFVFAPTQGTSLPLDSTLITGSYAINVVDGHLFASNKRPKQFTGYSDFVTVFYNIPNAQRDTLELYAVVVASNNDSTMFNDGVSFTKLTVAPCNVLSFDHQETQTNPVVIDSNVIKNINYNMIGQKGVMPFSIMLKNNKLIKVYN